MPQDPMVLVLPYVAAFGSTAGVAWVAWQRRSTEAARYFLALVAMAALWSGAAAITHMVTSVEAKLLWTLVRYGPISLLPVTWLLFALSFAGLGRRVTTKWIAALFILPLATLVLVLSNDSHALVFADTWISSRGPIPTVAHAYGPWFWVHTVYSYALVGGGMLLIGVHVSRAGGRFHGQAYMMVAGALAPVAANIWYLSSPASLGHLDPTPVAFAASTLFFSLGLFRFGLFDLTPVGRTRVLQSMPDGVVVFDESGRVLDVNPAADRMLGGEDATLQGSHVSDVGGVLAGIWDSRNERSPTTEAFIPLESGAVWVSWAIRPFAIGRFIPHKLGRGWLLQLRDVTRQKRIEQQLVEARDQAVEHSRLKSVFLANINHELRTPLTGIIGLAEVLDEELEGEHRDFIRMIRESGERLMGTLDALLAVADLKSGRLLPEVEAVDVGPELSRIVSEFRPEARRKGLDIWFDDPPDPVRAAVDPRHLEQAVRQVMDNAVKFTDRGAVAVTLTEQPGWAEVQVRDTGRGINPDFLPHVFDAFRQESAGATRAFEGTGLGLQIARGLLERMGGRIRVDSEVGIGTTVIVTLPLAVASPQTARSRDRHDRGSVSRSDRQDPGSLRDRPDSTKP